jgi:hypothetical protein
VRPIVRPALLGRDGNAIACHCCMPPVLTVYVALPQFPLTQPQSEPTGDVRAPPVLCCGPIGVGVGFGFGFGPQGGQRRAAQGAEGSDDAAVRRAAPNLQVPRAPRSLPPLRMRARPAAHPHGARLEPRACERCSLCTRESGVCASMRACTHACMCAYAHAFDTRLHVCACACTLGAGSDGVSAVAWSGYARRAVLAIDQSSCGLAGLAGDALQSQEADGKAREEADRRTGHRRQVWFRFSVKARPSVCVGSAHKPKCCGIVALCSGARASRVLSRCHQARGSAWLPFAQR